MKSRFIIEDKDIKILKSKNSNYSPTEGKLNQLYLNARLDRLFLKNGGPGSGFHGHVGIPGQRGGGAAPGSVGAGGQKEPSYREIKIEKMERVVTPKGFTHKVSTGVDGNESFSTGLRKIPRTKGLSRKEKELEDQICDVYENPKKLKKALDDYDKIASNWIKTGEKDKFTFETDAFKQTLPGWGTEKEINKCLTDMKKYSMNSSEYKAAKEKYDNFMYNRQALNSLYHQTANALCKAGFERAAAYAKKGSNIVVTSGGCGAGKGFGQSQLAKGNDKIFSGNSSVVKDFSNTYKKTQLVWDSAGDQCSSELYWLKAVAKKNGLNMVVLQTNNADKNMSNSLAHAQIKRATKPTDGRMVTAKVSADSYTIGNKNIQSFYNSNKNDKSVSFYTVDNPGMGNGYNKSGEIVSNEDYKLPSLKISSGIHTVPANGKNIEKAIKDMAYGQKVSSELSSGTIQNIIYGVNFGDSHSLKS